MLRRLRRYFDRDDLAPGDVFFPLDERALAGEPDVLGDQVEAKVRAAYVRLAARQAAGWTWCGCGTNCPTYRGTTWTPH